MDAKWIITASLAVLVASCSGGIYDASDFMKRKPVTAAVAAPADLPAAPAGEPAPETPATAAVTPVPAADGDAATVASTPPSTPPSTPTGDAATPAGTPVEVAAATNPPPAKSFFASFFSPASSSAAAAAAEAAAKPIEVAAATVEPAAPAALPPASQAETESAAAAPDSTFDGEISEAELAGEVEADPDVIAVPEMPDDGLAHDFVNVYTSRPDRPVEMYDGLPGVDWPGNTTLAMRTPDGDARGLFGGPEHPFARTVPGIPRQTVRAANGLLLSHSGINVSCVKPDLLGLVRRAERHFGKTVVVTSGYRSPAHNRRVRGAKHSQHMFCNALDLYMPGVARDDLARFFFSQPDRGGIGLYCHTRSIHIDTGKRRQWRWACRKG